MRVRAFIHRYIDTICVVVSYNRNTLEDVDMIMRLTESSGYSHERVPLPPIYRTTRQ